MLDAQELGIVDDTARRQISFVAGSLNLNPAPLNLLNARSYYDPAIFA